MGKIEDEFEESKKYELKTEDLIQKEFELSEEKREQNDFCFDTEEIIINRKKITLVKLTPENVARAEALIREDPQYNYSADPENRVDERELQNRNPDDGFSSGSMAFWLTLLKEYYEKETDKSTVSIQFNNENGEKSYDLSYDDIINGVVASVDRANGTQINRKNKRTRKILGERIKNYQNLIVDLKNKELNLFYEIARPTDEISNKGQHPSFASKFCHFACYWLFDDEKRDNFSIYDSVVSSILLVYAYKYCSKVVKKDGTYEDDLQTIKNSEKPEFEHYKSYSTVIDDIISNLDKPISRNGFDHLLWYYHKGISVEDVRIELRNRENGQ